MPIAFDGTIPDQIWTEGTPIDPIAVLPVTDPDGAVSYSVDGVPPGLVFSPQSLTLFGIPTEPDVGGGTITLIAADDIGEAQAEIAYTIFPAPAVLSLGDIDDMVLRLGTDIDIQLPLARGGSGNIAHSLEYRPADIFEGIPVQFTSLPEGLTYNPATGRLSGVLADSPANRGGSLFQVTLNTGPTRVGFNRDTGLQNDAFGGFRGRAAASGSSINPTRSTYTYADGRVVTFVWDAIWDNRGGIRLFSTPDIDDEGENQVPNNPEIYVLAAGPGEPPGGRPLGQYPFGIANRPPGALQDLVFPRSPYRLRFETNSTYYIEIVTDQVSTYDLVATDVETGVQIRRTFRIQLVNPVPGAPEAPVLQSQEVGGNNWSGVLAPHDDPTITGVWVSNVTEGFPEPGAALRVRHEYENNVANSVFVGSDIEPGQRRRVYIYYRNAQGFSTPLVVDFLVPAIALPVVPQPIRGLRVAAERNRLRPTWDRIDPYQQITGIDFRIDRGPGDSIPFSTGATTTTVIPGLINGVEREIGIAARNAAGRGPWSYISGTPQDVDSSAPFSLEAEGRPLQTRCQLQVLIDVFGGGFNYLAVENRVLAGEITEAEQGGPFGNEETTAMVELHTSDGLLRLVDTTGVSAYTLDNLRHKRCLINEIWETETGQYELVTRFGGWIDDLQSREDGPYTTVTLSLIDQTNQYGTAPIRLVDVPEEFVHHRIRRLFNAGGYDPDIDANSITIGEDFAVCAPQEELSGNLYELVIATLVSSGGTIAVVQNQSEGATGRVGRVTTRGRQGLRSAVATLSDRVEEDRTSNPQWENVIELEGQVANRWDRENIYNTVDFTLPDGTHFNEGEPLRDFDSIFGDQRGELRFPLDQVVVTAESARSLGRYLLRAYSRARLITEDLGVPLHFRPPREAVPLARAVLGDSVRLSVRPGGHGDHLVRVQRVTRITTIYGHGDRQYVSVTRRFGLLSPEATDYWTLSLQEANRLGSDTVIAPPLPGDLEITGNFEWELRDDDPFDAFVTSERFDRIWSGQSWPTYYSELDRDRIEERIDGRHAIVYGTDSSGDRYCHLTVFSESDRQWLIRGVLSDEDANPPTDTMQWDVDKWDDGKVWGA